MPLIKKRGIAKEMELSFSWFTLVISISIIFLLKSLFLSPRSKLPPGPPSFPILGNLQLFRKSFAELEPILQRLRSIYGPIVSLRIGPRKAIFITTSDLAHKTLIHLGATFADRPPALPTSKIISSDQHNISSAPYGPLWRLLRRNLSVELLHPSQVKSFSPARKWVLHILINNLKSDSGSGQPVPVMNHFQYAMFCLLVFMCFGEKVDDKVIREIESTQRALLLSFSRFNILNLFPEKLGKFLLRKRWSEFMALRGKQEKVLLPLIKARQEMEKKLLNDKEKEAYNDSTSDMVVCYVDTLLNMAIPEDGVRKLNDKEIVSLCSEFLNAGTDTTSTALQWIMANLVKHPDVQSKLFDEVKQVMRNDDGEKVREEDLAQLKYLRAVVLEGLRRHPPGHFVLPHAVTEDVRLDGYVVPKDASVNYMVAEIGWDPKVWEDPMAFKPERFMGSEGEVFDVTGRREIKMMPFGAGRRICPGLGLALLHLEYFVANLVAEFEWKAETGCDVDLSEKQEFTMVMKNPLKALISPRVS